LWRRTASAVAGALDRLAKIAEMDACLAELEADLGPVGAPASRSLPPT
jgi:hypothetical protein